jgi:hypothetical protein
MKKNPLNLDACEALDKIQKHFEKVKTLIGEAVKNKHSQQLKHYLIQLNVLLRRSEDLRLKFIYGASLNLSYYIEDEIHNCKSLLKAWE